MFEGMQNQPLALHTPLGPGALQLTHFRGSSGLAELFRYELELRAERPGLASFDKLLGQPVAVRIRQLDGAFAYFHGLVQSLERTAGDRTHVQYRAVLVPSMWLLTRNSQSRIFQQQSIPEILQKVFEPLRPHVEFRFQVADEYQPRDYCVQYQESDFDFASRLMEEEGIYYYFEHSENEHKLIVTDSHALLPAPPELALLQYEDVSGGSRDSVRVHAWHKKQELCSSSFTFWDQCFELADRQGHGFQTLEIRKRIADAVKAGQAEHAFNLPVSKNLEVYDCTGGYAKCFDGISPDGKSQPDRLVKVYDAARRRATRRAEAELAGALVSGGHSNCALLAPGRKFLLAGSVEDSGQYYLTRVEHEAVAPADRAGDTGAFEYRNQFTCLPVDVPYRPPQRTARPSIQGVQTATVVGASADEANTAPHVDKYGRVKVQFHWDRQRRFDGRSSCWLRVGQIWAGPRWGAFFWPRPGHEVIVAFENGDPDTPIITGSVYNSVNMPPLDLPEGSLSCGIKSCTPKGDPFQEANCVVFCDQPGTEFLQVHSGIHEVSRTNATRASDTIGPTLHTYGRLAFPLPGSGSGGGHDEHHDKHDNEHNEDHAKQEEFEKRMKEYKEKEEAEEKKKKEELAKKKPKKVIGMGGIFLGLATLLGEKNKDNLKTATEVGDFIGDWKSGVKKLLGKSVLGPLLGDTFTAKTEYVCGDRFDINLYGKHTEHHIWGDKQEYVLANPVDLLESIAKDFVGGFKAGKAILEGYKKLMWGLKLGPEPSGNFEMLLGKKTEFEYYGPFCEVRRGKKIEYEAEKFTMFTKDPVGLACFFLAVGVYTTMSLTDLLGRKYNTIDEEGEVELEQFWFVNAGTLVNKLAGILFEVESANAKTHHAKEDAKRTKEETERSLLLGKLEAFVEGGMWASKAALDGAKRRASDAIESLNDSVSSVTDDLGSLTTKVNDMSARRAFVYDDRYSLTASDLTLVAEDRALVPSGNGNVTIRARGGLTGDGAIRLEGGSGPNAGVLLMKPGGHFSLYNAGLSKRIDCINDNPGNIVISQGGLPVSPEIKFTPTSLTLKCGPEGVGSQIKLTATGLELNFGPPSGGAKMTMDATGIQLSTANGVNMLKIGLDGVEVKGLKVLDKAVAQLQDQGIKVDDMSEAITIMKFGLIKM